MARGRTISIYLPDGNPKGVKICEIPNSIVKAVVVPRNLINQAGEYETLNQVGIYFLFSEKEESSKFKTYVGEAEDIKKRLKQHDNSEKDFWNYAVCFFSGKKNLNKAHIKFLESFCHEKCMDAERTELVNSCSPTRSMLSPSEKDFALTFFDEIKLILGTLGYPIFDKFKKPGREEDIFFCKKKEAEASGNLTEDGFLIYKGSTANIGDRPSANKYVLNKRKGLVEEGILVKKDEYVYMFTKDFISGSPSVAAAIVIGGNANGWIEWKNSKGQTLDKVKRQANSK